jgi:hypothetical protein
MLFSYIYSIIVSSRNKNRFFFWNLHAKKEAGTNKGSSIHAGNPSTLLAAKGKLENIVIIKERYERRSPTGKTKTKERKLENMRMKKIRQKKIPAPKARMLPNTT